MSIKIGNIDVSYFKVGGDDCSIYLGDVKMYPTTPPTPPHDYSQDYLTFRALEDGTFSWGGSSTANRLSYSTDSGATWSEPSSAITTSTISSGDTVLWKGSGMNLSNSFIGIFSSTGNFDVQGNVMSLHFSDNFSGQTDLTDYPRAFMGLFSGCTTVINAENLVLPATTLSYGCYRNMFLNCTNMVAVPILSATTLADYCYYSMFSGCTSLTSAQINTDVIKGSTVCAYMFYNCTSLSALTCTARYIYGDKNMFYYWLSGVAEEGVFTRNPQMTQWGGALTPIPSGWTINPPEVRQQYFTIRSLEANNTITLTNNTSGSVVSDTSFSYSTDSGTTWSSTYIGIDQTATIATIGSGDTIMMRGRNINGLGVSYNKGHYFRATGNFEIEGNIMSLINDDDISVEFPTSNSYAFAQLFSGCTNLISAENLLILPKQLYTSAFNCIFRDCTALTVAPKELPSLIIGEESYASMFEGCTSLTTPPAYLCNMSTTSRSYRRMFCPSRSSMVNSSLTYTPKMFGNITAGQEQMFCGNGNLENVYCYWNNVSTGNTFNNWINYTPDNGVTFYKRSSSEFKSGASGIKSGWTVVDNDATQPSRT